MKKNIFIWAAIMAAIVATSCDKEENAGAGNPLSAEGQQISLAFENAATSDSSTRVFGAGTTEAWEKSISSATVLVFNSEGATKFRRDLSAAEITNATTTPVSLIIPDIYVGETVTLVVVANRTVPQNITTMDLLLAETDSDVANYNGTYSNVTSKAMRSGGFVMTGQTQAKIVQGTTPVTITLRRTVAKVEVSMATSSAFKNKYGNASITVNKITLSRGAQASFLMDRSSTSYAGRGNAFTAEQASSSGHNLFYIFEKEGAGEGSRVLLTIDATYDIDGSASTTSDQVPVTYEVELTGAGGGKILRNASYFVNGLIDGLTGNDITLTVTIASWETLQTQEVTLGK